MHLPLLQPITQARFYVSGDVNVDENAAIAPGVILQADPGSRIIVAAGVCIGMGAILHAHQGTIEVESGAILGAGVLIVGKVKIGTHACVGATATILNSDLAAKQVVQAGSIVGDVSRQVAPTPEALSEAIAETVSTAEATAQPIPPASPTPETSPAPPPEAAPNDTQPVSEAPATSPTIVYGQHHLNRLMLTLFPSGQYFKSGTQNGNSPDDRTE